MKQIIELYRNRTVSTFAFLTGVFIALVLLFFVLPVAFIWALNTLFALNIVLSWSTWLAVILLQQIVSFVCKG